MILILTEAFRNAQWGLCKFEHNTGTKLVKFTALGANMCSCCKPAIASALTAGWLNGCPRAEQALIKDSLTRKKLRKFLILIFLENEI